jgi:outer membrane protein TolC
MNRIYLFAVIYFCSLITLRSQSVLDQYVRQAIDQNLSIKENKSLERKQEMALAHAGKLAGPEVNFQTTYTLAAGGRSIALPVGSLLNDVYSTLNTLTGTQNFRQIENQEVQFLPDNYYDARFRITQPILQPEIKYNKLIKKEELTLAGLQTDQTVRDLIKDVKTSYFHWMQAREAISIIDQGIGLLQENKRITESLIKNGQAIPSALMRIESEIQQVNAQKQKAESDVTNAASYFNFLLNRPVGSEIIADTVQTVPLIPLQSDAQPREELQQLETGKKIQELALKLEQKQHAPTLGLQVDLGSQAYAPDWGGYVLAGLQLEIPIWDNQKSKLKQKEWQAQLDATQAKYEWSKNAFDIQLATERESLRSDLAIYDSYTSMMLSNNRYYLETLRRYKEGLSNYIELLDARTQVTNTQLEQNLAKYQSWLRQTNIERLAASTTIQ